MEHRENSAALARGWIEAWIRQDMAWLEQHLSPEFVHTSPFGRLEGRDFYLATVAPMAQKSVMRLVIKELIVADQQAAIWFENHTPQGIVDSCDWLWLEAGKIREIRSFYDSAKIRAVLSPEDQNSLGAY